jgi:Uma2 family endonuclease
MVAMTVLPEEMPRETLESVLRRIGDRPFTVEDLAELPDDSLRYEIDEGVLLVNAAPSDFHQLAASKLIHILTGACPRGFAVLGAPAVVISPIQVRIPDIVVVPSKRFNPRYRDIPPVLAVEVASPSTRAYDRTRKLEVYADFGIADYWIVSPDPEKPSITAFALDGKRYREAGFVTGGATFTAARPFPVSFTPLDLVDTGA